jgi:hypothetical protein
MGHRTDSRDKKANRFNIGHLANVVADRGDPLWSPEKRQARDLPLH